MENFSSEDFDKMISNIRSEKKKVLLTIYICFILFFFEFLFLFLNIIKLDYAFIVIIFFLFIQLFFAKIKTLELNVAIQFIEDLKKNKNKKVI
jgi:hypothetical protein